MAFTLTSGAFVFPIVPTIVTSFARTDRGEVETWNLQGRLVGAGAVAIKALVDSLEAASVDGRKWELKEGGTTLLELDPADSDMEHVFVTARGFPDGNNAQFTTNRAYSITVVATRRGFTSNTIAFSETVSLSDLILRPVFHEPLGGRNPIKQNTSKRPAVITQSGSATGLDFFPSFPAKLFRDSLLTDINETKTGGQPDRNGTVRNFNITWNYTFTLTTKQNKVKTPNTHPGGN